MSSYISFTNKTNYPVISILYDDKKLSDQIPIDAETKKYDVSSGTVSIKIKENHEKIFLDLWLSLIPEYSYNLIVKNGYAFLKKNP